MHCCSGARRGALFRRTNRTHRRDWIDRVDWSNRIDRPILPAGTNWNDRTDWRDWTDRGNWPDSSNRTNLRTRANRRNRADWRDGTNGGLMIPRNRPERFQQDCDEQISATTDSQLR